eukprot:g4917.t1
MARRGDTAQAAQETARLGVSTVVAAVATGITTVGAATPVVAPVCIALLNAKLMVDKAKCNKEGLEKLRKRCEMIAEQSLRERIEAVIPVMGLAGVVNNGAKLDQLLENTSPEIKPEPLLPEPREVPLRTSYRTSYGWGYEGQNSRALIWAAMYFIGWILQRLWCHLHLPDHCELVDQPLDALTDLVVLFSFSLAQAYWCEILLDDRFEELLMNGWIFGVILGTPVLTPVFCRALENWSRDHPDMDVTLSAAKTTSCVFGFIAAVVMVAWHFIRAFLTLPGMQLVSGSIRIDASEVNLFGIYTSSRAVIISWCILFTFFLMSSDDGWNYRGALLAWMLSLIAVFPHPVSYLWLGINTGIFIQGISANRLRFLGFAP